MVLTKRTKLILAALGVAAAIAFFLVTSVITFATDWAFICENTGSRKGYKDWCFGIRTGDWYQPSAVETFMQQHFPKELEHRWTSYAGTGRNIYGVRLLYGHGRPGPILLLDEKRLNTWFSPLPDAEKKAFYDLLVKGDRQAIQKKVNSIYLEDNPPPQ